MTPEIAFKLKAADIYHFLKESHEEFEADKLNKKKALICALLAYHLIEWHLWEIDPTRKKVNAALCMDYISNLEIELQTSFKIMLDLGNGFKHDVLNCVKIINESNVHEGPFDKTFDHTFDTSCLVVKIEDTTYKVKFELEKVVAYWDSVFANKE